ncbi:putative outer membrane protein [Gemmatimonas aurantiaca T-27]|nr:SusC/RagA family TonB-linked outer membrane protein [Gemmatimonas aurantiaca]BAH37762.1 putative outer membrane protein [Gemmatimonas aurantiaca T-27]
MSRLMRWLYRYPLLAAGLTAAPLAAQAQAQGPAVITGVVRSEFGDPLENANVYIVELAISIGTNPAGRYTLTIPADRIRGQVVQLRARAIGYKADVKPLTLRAGNQTFDWSLQKDVNRLQEVVTTGVTGATEQKKLAFSVAQVSDKDMPVPGSNPLSQLQGKVAGANIVSATGRPGSAPAIILRGPQSINASGRGQDPLYIIDGVISQGGLQDINPQDIENIEVVKGAAASSLYGSRAGNGVIQITTRSGKNQSEGVRFRAQVEYGQSNIENEYQYPSTHFMLMDETASRFCTVVSGAQDCSRTIDIYQEAYRINNDAGDFSLSPATIANDAGIARNPGAILARSLFQVNEFPKVYNPIKQFVTNGETMNTTLDATGRVGRTNFFSSINQLRQEGSVMFMSGYTRNSMRMNLDQQLGNNVNFSLRSSYSTANDYNSGGNFFGLTRQPANAELLRTDAKGRIFIRSVAQQQGAQNVNPAYGAQNFRPLNRIDRFVGNAVARWTPLSWLDAEANFGYDNRSNFQEWQQDRGYRTSAQSATNNGENRRLAGRSYSLNASGNVSARRNWFADALTSRLTLRYLYEAQDNRDSEARGQNLAVPGLFRPDAAITPTLYNGTTEQVRQLGFFTNLDLDYKGRYIFGALMRRDASSLFGAAERWKTYGRGSLAWRLSDEPWFGFDNSISDLKFRVSVGQAGNRPQFSAQYETFTIGAGGALSPNTLGNKNLRPEVSTETEMGMDLELFSRYGLTVTKSRNVIDDQILNPLLPAAAGFARQWVNAGQLTNNTWEVSLNIPIISSRAVDYSARINYDRTRSVITKLNIPEYFESANSQQGTEQMFKIVQGGSMGQIYGRRFVSQCSELPADFQSRCGAGLDYQRNSDGFVVYVGQGNTQADGITKNLWMTRVPAAQAPWAGGTTADPLNWGFPILVRDASGSVPVLPVGNALPDYRWSLSQNFRYKRLTAFGLLDATVGKDIFNIGRQWSFGDFMHKDADQAGKSVADARPMGYYFRAVSTGGIGGMYDVLGPNNNTVEDASFVKIREVSLGYRLGSVGGFGNWTVSVIGRNLMTFSKYKGFDPEVGTAGGALGSGVLNAVDAFVFPNLRQFTFSLSTSF